MAKYASICLCLHHDTNNRLREERGKTSKCFYYISAEIQLIVFGAKANLFGHLIYLYCPFSQFC